MKEIRDDLSVCLSTGQLQTNDDESKTTCISMGIEFRATVFAFECSQYCVSSA